ncbi:Uncharacterized protein QTN25_000499 [Entamoeba marina]
MGCCQSEPEPEKEPLLLHKKSPIVNQAIMESPQPEKRQTIQPTKQFQQAVETTGQIFLSTHPKESVVSSLESKKFAKEYKRKTKSVQIPRDVFALPKFTKVDDDNDFNMEFLLDVLNVNSLKLAVAYHSSDKLKNQNLLMSLDTLQ